ncbi:MAG: hypothetical protein A2048_01760 [Deltaproteobacteria bacterium GWA2_45_12]|nr:MAG: hypothetical protein A2048_01760 [Deltaproteobacteria bacterium GWA2_45_12]
MICIFLLTGHGKMVFASCLTPPPSLVMDEQMIGWLKTQTKKSKTRIALFPFEDRSQIEPDLALGSGFAIVLYDFLKKTNETGIYHPFVMLHSTRSNNLTNADLFDDEKILQAASSIEASHAVLGLFQRQPDGTLRYFIKIMEVASKKQLGTTIEEFTDQGDRFFASIGEASSQILKTISGSKISTDFLRNSVAKSPSYEAYRYYLKGMLESSSYNATRLEVAKAWFEKATSLSYGFKSAFHEKARTLFMLAIIQKIMGQDSSASIGEAAFLLKEYPLESEKKTKNGEVLSSSIGTERWLKSHLAFVSGMNLVKANQQGQAQKELGIAISLVPEDGLAQLALSRLGKTGDANLVSQLNPCNL